MAFVPDATPPRYGHPPERLLLAVPVLQPKKASLLTETTAPEETEAAPPLPA
jgi:hypothetical protein